MPRVSQLLTSKRTGDVGEGRPEPILKELLHLGRLHLRHRAARGREDTEQIMQLDPQRLQVCRYRHSNRRRSGCPQKTDLIEIHGVADKLGQDLKHKVRDKAYVEDDEQERDRRLPGDRDDAVEEVRRCGTRRGKEGSGWRRPG